MQGMQGMMRGTVVLVWGLMLAMAGTAQGQANLLGGVYTRPPNAVTGDNGLSTFISIDPRPGLTGGVATEIGPIGFERCSGMAVHKASGTLYATCQRPSDHTTWVLITINPSNGLGHEVGPINPAPVGINDGGGITDISFDGTGTLFAYYRNNPNLENFQAIPLPTYNHTMELRTINLNVDPIDHTVHSTLIGLTCPGDLLVRNANCDDGRGNGMAFSFKYPTDPAIPNGLLFLSVTPGQPHFATLDTQTGQMTFSSVTMTDLTSHGFSQFYALNAMAFDPDAPITDTKVFASLQNGTGQFPNVPPANYLVTVVPETGAVTVIGQIRDGSGVPIYGLDSLVFVPQITFSEIPTVGPISGTWPGGSFQDCIEPCISGEPFPVPECTLITFSAPFTGTGVTADWMWGDGSLDSPGGVDFTGGTVGGTHTYPYTMTGFHPIVLTVTNQFGKMATSSTSVTVQGLTVGTITDGPISPLAVSAATINLSAPYTGANVIAVWDWDADPTNLDIPSPNTTQVIPPGPFQGTVSGTHTYTAAGVYTVALRLYDNCGRPVTSVIPQYVVVYDPSAGFVTGGGWINSPKDAYTANPSLTGKATFGFVAKYQKGATYPTGNTEFQFKVGNLNFHATSYQWLVVAGAKAQYKGWGTINNAGNYSFLLTAIDGQVNGGGGFDKFRIKITNGTGVVYDNQPGAPEDSDASTVAAGSIVIQQ